jgi:hypothetical protein
MANEKISAMTAASSINDADVIPLVQSGANKKSAWSLFKSTLKTYFDTLYTSTAAVAAQISTALTGYLTAATAAATYATIASQPRSIFMDAGDQSTTSNVATDITELVFSVAANKRYFVRGHIRVGCKQHRGRENCGHRSRLCHFLQCGGWSFSNNHARDRCNRCN